MKKTGVPIYKKWWFYLIVTLLIVGIIGNIIEPEEEAAKEPEKAIESTTKKEHPFNSNEGITAFIKESGSAFNLIEVNGVYVEEGNNSVVITLDAEDDGMDLALNQVVMMVKLLHEADLSEFKEIGISVKADMEDGSKGYAIKSSFDVKTIESDKVKTFRIKNIADQAISWWQL